MSSASGVLDVQGVGIFHRASGPQAALPVVFIHGWAGSSRMWAETIDSLSSTYLCVTLDLPGHGESSKPPVEWYSLRRFGEVVEEFSRTLGLDRPVLVGHSMGGTIALEVAAGRALPLRGVICVNPVVSGRIGFGPPLPETVARPVAAVTRKMWPVAARLLRGAPDRVGRSAPDAWRRMREDVGRTSGDAAVGSIQAVLRADLSLQIPSVVCPAMLVVGRSDRVVPPSEGRLAARLVPGSTLLELNCGHHPHDERRAEFLAETSRFLESVVGN